MDVESAETVHVDGRLELRQVGIELRFLCAPIEAIAPVRCETLNVVTRCAVRPVIGEFDLVGEVGEGEFLLESADGGVGHVNLEGSDGVASHWFV